MLWIIILMGILVAILIYAEYRDHDCLNGKECTRSVCKPYIDEDNTVEYIDKISRMVKNNYDYMIWRMALLVGIIVTLPIVYYLECRIPTIFEWFVVGSLIFIATYLSCGWIWAHFFYPNGYQIEQSLQELKDKLN